MKKTLLLLSCLLSLSLVQGQHDYLRIGTSAPLHASVGLEYSFFGSISIQAKGGYVPSLFQEMFLSYGSFGKVPSTTTQMLSNYVNPGLSFEFGPVYHFEKNYIGLYFQNMVLRSVNQTNEWAELVIDNASKLEQVEDYMNEFYYGMATTRSSLSQLGVTYGRRFYGRNNPAFGLGLEFSMAANVGSNHVIEHEDPRATVSLNNLLSEDLQAGLNETFKNFFFPSLNLYFYYIIGYDTRPNYRNPFRGKLPVWAI